VGGDENLGAGTVGLKVRIAVHWPVHTGPGPLASPFARADAVVLAPGCAGCAEGTAAALLGHEAIWRKGSKGLLGLAGGGGVRRESWLGAGNCDGMLSHAWLRHALHAVRGPLSEARRIARSTTRSLDRRLILVGNPEALAASPLWRVLMRELLWRHA